MLAFVCGGLLQFFAKRYDLGFRRSGLGKFQSGERHFVLLFFSVDHRHHFPQYFVLLHKVEACVRCPEHDRAFLSIPILLYQSLLRQKSEILRQFLEAQIRSVHDVSLARALLRYSENLGGYPKSVAILSRPPSSCALGRSS